MTRQVLRGATLAFALLASTTPAEARRGDRLVTDAGVLTIGGRFAFELMHVNPDPGGSATGVMLNFSPSFGGFVIKNLLLEGTLSARIGLGDLYDNVPKTVGFSFGIQYLFNFRSIVIPYLGFRFGPDFAIPQQGSTLASLGFSIPAGILISLNERVGLLIGTELAIDVGVSGAARGTTISLPIGYLGVNAFF
jgi:hypothetical protein